MEDDEVKDRRVRLNRIIDQGSKLEHLYSLEEFQAFLSWIADSKDKLSKQVLTGKAPNGGLLKDKELWHAMGAYNALTDVVEGGESFANKAQKARNQLRKLDEDIANMPEALK